MKPLAVIAVGLILVVVDIRYGGFDVLTDVLGWLACFWALLQMSRMSSWFGIGVAGAALGAASSMFHLSAEPTPLISMLDQIATVLMVFGTCSGIMALAQDADPGVASMANILRWVTLGLGLVSPLAVLAGGPTVIVVLGLAALAVVIWFIMMLFSVSRREYAVPPTS